MSHTPPVQEAVTIPLIDIRNGTMIDLVKAQKAQARQLMKLTRRELGIFTRVIMPLIYPVLDFFSWRWLKRSGNPYRNEIKEIKKIVGGSGIIAQNVSYEWTCTSGALKTPSTEAPQLVRVMDWIISGMGKYIIVAHQSGKAGDFYNITLPGLSGVFNGVAKGRFAAVINQAPMRRHLLGGIVSDWVRNHIRWFKSKALPPSHLLRKAFETAASYQEAKEMLMKEPVAAPAIFVLSGVKAGEGCVIERLEDKAIVREMKDDRVFTANHFQTNLNGVGGGWTPRGVDNHARAEAAGKISAVEVEQGFDWFKDPLANKFSSMAMVADAATGKFRLMGTSGDKVVTQEFRI